MVNTSALAAVKPRLRNIYFAADNGLDIHFLRLLVKINCAIHYAVVGNGNAVHAKFFGTRQKQIYFGGAVKQAVLRMHMQMGKFFSH